MHEGRELTAPYFATRRVMICGLKTELIPLPGGRLKDAVLRGVPDRLWRFLGSTCRLGGFLVATMEKRP